jgi:N-hydroxyarylamine O-acetyltransferase
VGFGSNTPTVPLPLQIDMETSGFGKHYKLGADDQLGYVLCCASAYEGKQEHEWEPLYSFDLGYVTPADIELGNYYASTSPESFFTSVRVAVLPVKGAQVVLLDNSLKLRHDGNETELQLADDESYLQAVHKYFGIQLNVAYGALAPLSC